MLDEELLLEVSLVGGLTMVVGMASFLACYCFRFHAFEVAMASLLRSSLRGLKAASSKLFTARFCLSLSGVNCSAQMRE